MFKRSESWERLAAEHDQLQLRLETLIGHWLQQNSVVGIDVSKWENPYDYITSFNVTSSLPGTASLLLAIGGTRLDVFVNDSWVLEEHPYEEALVLRLLSTVSAGDVREHRYRDCHVIEVGHGESKITKCTTFFRFPGAELWRRLRRIPPVPKVPEGPKSFLAWPFDTDPAHEKP